MLLKTMTDRSESFTPVNGSHERIAHARPFCYTVRQTIQQHCVRRMVARVKPQNSSARATMRHFGVDAKIDQNIGHHSENVWWNVTVPFKDHDELVSAEFSEKLCGSLAKVAAAFATLTPYRVSVKNK